MQNFKQKSTKKKTNASISKKPSTSAANGKQSGAKSQSLGVNSKSTTSQNGTASAKAQTDNTNSTQQSSKIKDSSTNSKQADAKSQNSGATAKQTSAQGNGTSSQQAKQASLGKDAPQVANKVNNDDSQSAKIKPANAQESEPNNAEKLDDSKNPKAKQPPKHHWWLDAIYFILGTIALGGIATLLGGKNMMNFGGYTTPPATAPAWLFPIMWALIYIAIGVATFLMWRDKQITARDRKINLVLYFVHMAFNITWPLWFFMLNMPIVACIWLAIILILALITAWRYFVANIASGIIFCVYVAWLIYAFYLNLGVCLLL